MAVRRVDVDVDDGRVGGVREVEATDPEPIVAPEAISLAYASFAAYAKLSAVKE